MNRQEIDLREKIAAEIEEAVTKTGGKWNDDKFQAYRLAVGIVRSPLMHNSICPCSICNKWPVKSCSDECNKHHKITQEEAEELAKIQGVEASDAFTCDWCNNGQNEWAITELLWDIENEFAITPCCHTEATEALDLPENEGYDQRKEDEQSYRYSVTGSL